MTKSLTPDERGRMQEIVRGVRADLRELRLIFERLQQRLEAEGDTRR